MRLRTLALFAAFLLPLPMMADTTYTYTGADFTTASGIYSTSDFISGWFTVDAPMAANFAGTITPTSFAFTDGVQTITNVNADTANNKFGFAFDASGNMVNWSVQIDINMTQYGSGQYDTIAMNGGSSVVWDWAIVSQGGQPIGHYGEAQNSVSGRWTESATPEPSSFVLFLTGLICVAGLVRRRCSCE
jgi:hypothetical protein